MAPADHLSTARLDRAAALRGAAAVMSAIDLIGMSEATDHDLAKHLVDAEPDVRALLQFALAQLACEPQ